MQPHIFDATIQIAPEYDVIRSVNMHVIEKAWNKILKLLLAILDK
jgi:hypothetical protein